MYSNPRLAIAFNAAQSDLLCVALNAELPADGSVPEWVQLIPPGLDVAGIDGRAWINDTPEAVVGHFLARQAEFGRDLPFDWVHATEIKAPQGEDAPASGWGKEMQVRDGGAIWARVEWTERGRNSITSKEYRYLSPVLIYEKATGRIVGISSVGLTNVPNLNLKALNHALNRGVDPDSINREEQDMLLKALCQALGLGENATQEQALAAVATLKNDHATALNQASNPSLDKFVPRADYDGAVSRANNAEQALSTLKQTQLDGEIDTAINAALEAGKITPASVEYHKGQCQSEDGLKRFNAYVESQAVITADTGLDKKTADGDQGLALNAEEAAIAVMFGNSAEDLQKHGQASA